MGSYFSKPSDVIMVPEFTPEAYRSWRCLRQWCGKTLSSKLPSIRCNNVEISVLEFSTFPAIQIISDNIFHIGKHISDNCVSTTDYIELKEILNTINKGELLMPLVKLMQDIEDKHCGFTMIDEA
jgi:hypothetical protein